MIDIWEDGNYPPLDTEEITVEGTFSLYEENNEMYCTLANARLVDYALLIVSKHCRNINQYTSLKW